MSAPLVKNIKTPYSSCIVRCENCLVECQRCLSFVPSGTDFRRDLDKLTEVIIRTVCVMRSNSRFTTRYLVDCSDACSVFAGKYEQTSNSVYQRAVTVCKELVPVCRQGSLI